MSEAVTKTERERERTSREEISLPLLHYNPLNNKHLDEIFCIPFVTGKKNSERETRVRKMKKIKEHIV